MSGMVRPAAAGRLVADLMERYGLELRRHLIGMMGHEDDADDVLQEVWIKAHESPPEDGPGSNVRAWLYRVATNAALDRLARSRRRRAALAGRAAELEPEQEPGPEHGALALSSATRARVRAQVACLPLKQREAVWLRWAAGADYAEIAGRLGCSEESARANVYNGMKKLRCELFDVWKKEYAT